MPAGHLKTIENCPNSGDDIAGTIYAIGSAVIDFHIGDRVAALHELGTPGGSYAEYALVYDWTTFHLSDNISFEEAATVPMAALMASIALFGMLEVAAGPWKPVPDEVERPVVIYGAASAVGAFAIKLAKKLNVHPLICIAGRGTEFVAELLDDRDTIIDYRKGDDFVISEIQKALNGGKLYYAFDAVSNYNSIGNLIHVLAENSKFTMVLPDVRKDIPGYIETSLTMAGSLWRELANDTTRDNRRLGKLGVEKGGMEFGGIFTGLVGRWLNEGKLKPHPHVTVEGGLEGVETALKALKSGKNSAMKYVVRIADTPGLQAL